MANSIYTNLISLNLQRNLGINMNKKKKNSKRISSGSRISSATENSADLAISSKAKSQIKSLEMSKKNIEDSKSLLETIDSSLKEINDIFIRARELTIQGSNDTLTSEDKRKIYGEMHSILSEVSYILNNAEFNEKKVFQDKELYSQIGANKNEGLELDLNFETLEEMMNNKNLNLSKELNLIFKQELSGIIKKIEEFDFTNSGNNFVAGNGRHYNVTDLTSLFEPFITLLNKIPVESPELKVFKDKVYKLIQDYKVDAKNHFEFINKNLDKNHKLCLQNTSYPGSLFGKGAGPTCGEDGVSVTVGQILDIMSDPNKIVLNNYTKKEFTDNMKKFLSEFENDFLNDKIDYNLDLYKYLDFMAKGEVDLSSERFASLYLNQLDSCIDKINSKNAKIGSTINRLDNTFNINGTYEENLSSYNSKLYDDDVVKEHIEFTKNSLLVEVNITFLAQANQKQNDVLRLLK